MELLAIADKLTTQADLDLQKATSITTTAGSELNIRELQADLSEKSISAT